MTRSPNALEKIFIDCNETEHNQYDCCWSASRRVISPLLSQKALARVSELFLADLLVTEHELLRLCRHMSDTICSVEFRKIVVSDDGDWKNVLEKSKVLKFPNLKSFILDSCCESGAQRFHVEDYLLCKSEVNPV